MPVEIIVPTTSQPAQSGQSGLSRRTVVRTAAHSAWAVPVVMAATSAPAFAASSGLKVTAFSAGYAAQGAAAVRPDILNFSATVTAAGATTTGLTLTISIPKGTARFGSGNLYDVVPAVCSTATPYTPYTNVTGGAPGANPLADWSFAIVATPGDPTYSHDIVFTRTGPQIPSGGSATLSNAAIKFSPALPAVIGSPYKPWVGSSYTVRSEAEATNTGAPGFLTAAVAEASSGAPVNTATLLDINNFVATRTSPGIFGSDAVLTLSVIGAGALGAVTNSGRKSCGPITLRFQFQNVSGHRYYRGTPSNATAPAGWTGGTRTGSGTAGDPWTYSFTVSSPPTAYANSAVAGNPAAEANTPDFADTTITLDNSGNVFNSTSAQTIVCQAFSTTDAAFGWQTSDTA